MSTIVVTKEDQERLGLLPTTPSSPSRSGEILDNGTFPKTRPGQRKRTRNRWKRKARSG